MMSAHFIGTFTEAAYGKRPISSTGEATVIGSGPNGLSAAVVVRDGRPQAKPS
jgi:hypothetical protein